MYIKRCVLKNEGVHSDVLFSNQNIRGRGQINLFVGEALGVEPGVLYH